MTASNHWFAVTISLELYSWLFRVVERYPPLIATDSLSPTVNKSLKYMDIPVI